MGLKVREFSAQFRHDKWLKLYVSPEAIRALVEPPHIAYKSFHRSDQTQAPHTVKQFAETGARSIENNGPMQELRSLLYRHMQPWRRGEILHVGRAPVYRLNSRLVSDPIDEAEQV